MTNPLVDLPVFIPFDAIRPAHVVPAVEALLERTRSALRAIEGDTRSPSFANTLLALDTLTDPLDRAMNALEHLVSVATSPELRGAYAKAQPEVSAFYGSLWRSERLFAAVQACADANEATLLPRDRRRYLDTTLAALRRSGAGLDTAGKERLEAIDRELATLTVRFAENVLDATNAFEILLADRDALRGMPESAIDAAREAARVRGKEGYRLTLQGPSYQPAMTYLDDGTLRERLFRAYNSRGTEAAFDNRATVHRILELRRKKAKLLGFRHFADLVLDDRMAKRGEAAREFLVTLRERARSFFERERDELDAFRRELEGPSAPTPAAWDLLYYAEKLRRARYDLDEEELRPYFPLDRVLVGLFALAERLFGVRIAPLDGLTTWHPLVRAYRVHDERGEELGAFYVDVFPREEKREGAWMQPLVTAARRGEGGGSRLQVAALVANVTPPIGDAPALLYHREVQTLFHEFGHLLHALLTDVGLRSQAGTAVAWDFVELPSMLFENFTWERAALDLFARHHQTDEPLPGPLFERMRRARAFRAATAMMRQIGLSEIDLALHMEWDLGRDGDAVAYARRVLEEHSPAALPVEHAMLASFLHLFSSQVGYAAGYYSYKWAEVLDADAFASFLEAGVLARPVGRAFRNTVLSQGDSDDPAALFRSFKGRDPSLLPLLERYGLIACF